MPRVHIIDYVVATSDDAFKKARSDKFKGWSQGKTKNGKWYDSTARILWRLNCSAELVVSMRRFAWHSIWNNLDVIILLTIVHMPKHPTLPGLNSLGRMGLAAAKYDVNLGKDMDFTTVFLECICNITGVGDIASLIGALKPCNSSSKAGILRCDPIHIEDASWVIIMVWIALQSPRMDFPWYPS